jgi:hypothetical protein
MDIKHSKSFLGIMPVTTEINIGFQGAATKRSHELDQWRESKW